MQTNGVRVTKPRMFFKKKLISFDLISGTTFPPYSFIIDIWRSMVSGVPIDEQRTQRTVGVNQPPSEHPSTDASFSCIGGGGGDGDDSDDERDPNDIITRNPGPVVAPATGGAYSNLDESDFESLSDDSD